MLIPVDVETIPCQNKEPEDFIDNVKVPGTHKKEETKQKYREEHYMDYWLKTALDPSYGELYCIAWSVPSLGEEVFYVERKGLEPSDETDLLQEFATRIKRQIGQMLPEWIGHHVAFDLGFLAKRAIIRRVKMGVNLPWDRPAWSAPYKDTMYMWAGAKDKVSLKELCTILGVPQEHDMDGSEVWDAVSTGNGTSVVDHCVQDVRRTLACYNIITGKW